LIKAVCCSIFVVASFIVAYPTVLTSVFLHARFEIHIGVLLEIYVFWDVTVYYCIGSIGLLNPEDDRTTTL
jgi:hypothetical protein